MAKDQSHYNRIAAIFFLLVGIFFAFYARSVEIGTWNEPGPGFLPFWAGTILVDHGSVALLFGSYARKAWPAGPPFSLSRIPGKGSWRPSCP